MFAFQELTRMRCLGRLVRYHAAVAQHAHLGNVQPLDFRLLADAISNHHFHKLVNDEAQDAEWDETGANADEPGDQLAETAAVKQAQHTHFGGALRGHARIHHHVASVGHSEPMRAVPALAIGAVAKQPERETSPGAV